MVLELFRSSDGGLSWERTGVYGSGHGDDHPQMVTDPRSDHTGTVYTTCLCSFEGEEWTIGLFRSSDHGTHTTGPVKVASAPLGMGVFDLNPLVLSDGFLFIPFQVFEPKPLEKRSAPTFDTSFTTSTDSGVTFSSPVKIRTQVLDPKASVPSPYGGIFFAADTRSTKFRDRIYMLADEAVSGHYLLRLSYSNDRGKTWSEPKDIAPLPAGGANEYQPAISISRDGVIGISWFDTRDSAGTYREYFTASLDGGDSFLPAVRVSAEPSPIDSPGNDIARHTIDSPRITSTGELEFSFVVTSRGFRIAGEYMGSVADDIGTFHLFWSDNRSGRFQAWTTAVRVAPPDVRSPTNEAARGNSTQASRAGKLVPIFDPANYDRSTGIEEIPVRFQNISADSVCKPLLVQLQGKDDTHGPQILNANNGKFWNGAQFDYSGAFGDFACLQPGEITGAIVWRVKVGSLSDPFVSFLVTISGETVSSNR